MDDPILPDDDSRTITHHPAPEGDEPPLRAEKGTPGLPERQAVGASSGGLTQRETIASDLPDFIRAVEELGLLPLTEIQSALGQLPTSLQAVDSRRLARELVRSGKLTPYQAGAICQGKAKGLVIGRYLVQDKLGEGGMGMVFKAEHRRLKRIVALKILPPSSTRKADSVERFQRESQAAAKLDHPNLVRAIDADEAGGMHFLVMEFVEGKDLHRLLRERGPLPLGVAVDCIIQAARGLAAAHGQGIIHRDIKPSNLILDNAGILKVLDLGLARLDDSAGPSAGDVGSLTMVGSIMGTTDYMSPEQAFDPRLADARSDIYSLGCTFYAILTGKAVYGGRTVMQKLLGHREAPVPSLRILRPDVSPALDDVFRRMLAKKPSERPRSMTEVVEILVANRPAAEDLPGGSSSVLRVFDDRSAPPKSRLRRRSAEGLATERPTPLPRRGVLRSQGGEAERDGEGSGFRSQDKGGRVLAIHGVDAVGFHHWIDLVRSKGLIPVCLSAHDGGGRPEFAAVAAPNRKGYPWEILLHPDAVELGKHANQMATRGSSLALLCGYAATARTGLVTLFRQSPETSTDAIGLDLPALSARLGELDRTRHRVFCMAGYPEENDRRFALVSTRIAGPTQRWVVDLSEGQFRTFLDRERDEGFIPVSLTSYAVGTSVRFGALLHEFPDRSWEMAFHLTAEELQDEHDRRARRGLSPSRICGYRHGGSTRYVAVWTERASSRRTKS